jgi:hypothetical protein
VEKGVPIEERALYRRSSTDDQSNKYGEVVC